MIYLKKLFVKILLKDCDNLHVLLSLDIQKKTTYREKFILYLIED